MTFVNRLSARDWLVGAATLAAISIGAVSPAAALAASAGTDAPVAQPRPSALDRCEQLLADGKLVECRATLLANLRSDTLSDADREKTISLIERTDRRMKTLSADELAVQRAEFAMSEGDLTRAQRYAMDVSAKAKPELAQAASAVLKTVAERREAMAPIVPNLLAQAAADFQSGRYAEAKAALSAVSRSGVTLAAADARTLDTYTVRIADLERTTGKVFDTTTISAAMLQPGVMRPAPEPPATQPPTTEPIPAGRQPAQQPATPAPAPAAEPAPAPAPAPAPVQAAEPTPPPAAAPTTIPQDQAVQLAMRIEAQRLVAEGDQLFAAGDYAGAARKYESALGSNNRPYLTAAEIAAAEQGLANARNRIGQGSGNIGADAAREIQVIREKAIAEFDNDVKQANAAIASGDMKTARDRAASAGATVRRNSDYLRAEEREAMNKQVDELNKQIETKGNAIQQQQSNAQAKAAADNAAAARQAQAADKQKKIYEAISKARALQQEQKYAEALQVIDQILFLDPTDPTALLLRDVVQDLMVYKRASDAYRVRSDRVRQVALGDQEAIIPPVNMMEYPPDWPARSYYRGVGAAYNESPENQKILSALDKTKIRANFAENSLEQVVGYIQKSANVNMDVDWASLRSLGIDPETPVTLSLTTDVPAKVVLERVLSKVARDQHSRPDFAVDSGILTVASPEALKRYKPVAMYPVTDLLLDIPDYSEVPTVDLQQVLQNAKGGKNATPFRDNVRRGGDDRPDRATRIRRIIDVIEHNVDPESWTDNGGDVGSIQELNGSLVITTTPKNHREIQGVLAKLREIRSLQINVEARFLLVSQDFFEQIGFNIDVYFNAASNQVQAAQATDPGIRPSDFFDFTQSGNALRRVLDSTTYAPNGSVVPQPSIPPGAAVQALQNTVPPNRWSPIGVGSNTLGIANGLAQDNSFASQLLRAAPALGIAGQFLDDVQVDFLIRATQADRRNITLTAPRITFTNGQISNIYVANQQAFVSDLTPVVGQSAVGFDPDIGTISPGVVLLVEGVVSADRRYVTMNIDAGVSKLERFDQASITAVAGGQLVNSAETGTFVQLPLLTVTRVQTTATVPDEGTLLLGGQRIMTELEIESGVPVLSKLPILNRFFTNRVISRQESSLMILVKPTIIIQTEQEEKNFPGLNDGLRTGAMGG